MEAVKKILMSPRPAVRALALYLPGVAAALAVAAASKTPIRCGTGRSRPIR